MNFIAADINYLAVIVAALSSIAIGSLWFGPLFGTTFSKGVGMDKWDEAKQTEMKKRMPVTYVKQLVMSLLMAFVVAYVVWMYRLALPEVGALMAGLQSGFWLWLGIVLPVRYGESLWNGQEFKYVAIDLGYWLVILLTYGAILSLWR